MNNVLACTILFSPSTEPKINSFSASPSLPSRNFFQSAVSPHSPSSTISSRNCGSNSGELARWGPGATAPPTTLIMVGRQSYGGAKIAGLQKIFDSSDFSDTLASSSLHCPLVIVRIDFLILAIIRQFPLLRLRLDYL